MANLSTIPPRLDLQAYGGDDTTITLKFKNSSGAYFVPSGTLTAQIRVTPEATDYNALTIVKNVDSVSVTVPGTVARALADASATASVYVGNDLVTAPIWFGVWDLQETAGTSRTLCFGNIAIVSEVTR